MKFGQIPVRDASGTILAHSVVAAESNFKKGRVLSPTDVDMLARTGIAAVMVARLETEDVWEDDAAQRIADAVRGAGVTISTAHTGRTNLYADGHGLALVDAARVNAINAVHESITIATLAPFERVERRQMLATIKIIPFAAPAWAVDAVTAIARDGSAVIDTAGFHPRCIELISTTLPGLKASLLDKNRAVIEARAEGLGSKIDHETRCAHEATSIAAAVLACATRKPDMILIFGAAATIDRADTVPEGIVSAGGTLVHFGMPVDPGNLLLMGTLGSIPVIGLPGCARSPKLNGLDFVLQRLCAGLTVTPSDIMAMGVGGLLKEIPSRPQPRETGRPIAQRASNISAIVLAAGRSTRMGDANKLLLDLRGEPMILRTVSAVRASKVTGTIVVTGHEAGAVTQALDGQAVTFVHNPRYAVGISTSLKAGMSALPADCDGVLVCLGDMPAVTGQSIANLIDAFNPAESRCIIVPTYQGKRGNPVLFAHAYFEDMLHTEGDTGARALLSAYADAVYEVEMDDAGVLADADTPAAFAALEAEFKS